MEPLQTQIEDLIDLDTQETGINPIDRLPPEMIDAIFSKLKRPTDLVRCGLVCELWHKISNAESLWKALPPPSIAFGQKQWAEYFGLDVEESSLPVDIHKILKSQCPFSEKEIKVEDTHLLVLIPGSINGKLRKLLTLKTFGEHIKLKFPDLGQTGYRYIWDAAKECDGNGESHWVLMTKKILTGSRNKSFAEQQDQVGKRNYQVPGTLDVVACVISEYARSNKDTRLFGDSPLTYTRCQERLQGCQVVIGGFAPAGLDVSCYDTDDEDIGIAALRKL